jgi:cellulose biosynthesis protein BcsQ
MKVISVFNNKGGVGKTTLTFHLAHALAEMGKRVLIVDFDPQCNLTILGMDEERLHDIWRVEDAFVEDFNAARESLPVKDFEKLISEPRSIHFLLKPTEDGAADLASLVPPVALASNLDLIPGRLTMHRYEDKIAARWSDVYLGDPLAIRTIARPRELAEAYARQHGYDFVIMDTSPSLGTLNKVIISTADGFVIPCMPDMFSLYGIRNIGNALVGWKKQFDTINHLLSSEKRKQLPANYVSLLGFTIYNAKKYKGVTQWDLALAHYNYAMEIPGAIGAYISEEIRPNLSDSLLKKPIGEMAIMHSHTTLPNMAQRYHLPMWKVPSALNLDVEDSRTIQGNRTKYEDTAAKYKGFAADLLKRINTLG